MEPVAVGIKIIFNDVRVDMKRKLASKNGLCMMPRIPLDLQEFNISLVNTVSQFGMAELVEYACVKERVIWVVGYCLFGRIPDEIITSFELDHGVELFNGIND